MSDIFVIENQSLSDTNVYSYGVSFEIPIKNNVVGVIANIDVSDGNITKKGKKVGFSYEK